MVLLRSLKNAGAHNVSLYEEERLEKLVAKLELEEDCRVCLDPVRWRSVNFNPDSKNK